MENIIGKLLSKEYSVLISKNGKFQERKILKINEINSLLLKFEILGIEINIKE